MSRLAASWMISLALVAAPALAQVYKWVDAGGKVNYGDKPPAGSTGARALDEDAGMVSIVQGMPKEEIERLRARYEQQRLQRLEREVEALRAREFALGSVPREAAYDEVYLPAYGYAWPWWRRPVAGHHRRWLDHPNDKHRPSTRPLPPSRASRAVMPG